jgi:hypothetical protein
LDQGNRDPETIGAILRTKALTDLVFHPVSKLVNSAHHNDPSNLVPVQTEFDF